MVTLVEKFHCFGLFRETRIRIRTSPGFHCEKPRSGIEKVTPTWKPRTGTVRVPLDKLALYSVKAQT